MKLLQLKAGVLIPPPQGWLFPASQSGVPKTPTCLSPPKQPQFPGCSCGKQRGWASFTQFPCAGKMSQGQESGAQPASTAPREVRLRQGWRVQGEGGCFSPGKEGRDGGQTAASSTSHTARASSDPTSLTDRVTMSQVSLGKQLDPPPACNRRTHSVGKSRTATGEKGGWEQFS